MRFAASYRPLAGLSALAVLASLAGCSNSKTDDTPSGPSVTAVLQNYNANLYSAYSDAVDDEQAFSDQVDAFLADPTEKALSKTRDSWLASREHYMVVEGARFYDGPD